MLDHDPAGWPYWIAFAATVVLAFVLGAAIGRIIIRPVERAPVLTAVVVFIGLLLILNSVAGWIFGYTIKSFPSPFPSKAPFGLTIVSAHELGAISVTLVVLLLVYLFFRFTPLGLAMRAAAQNPDSSRPGGHARRLDARARLGTRGRVRATAGMMVRPSCSSTRT